MASPTGTGPVTLRVDGPDAVTELASLRTWLGEVPALRGRVDAVHAPPRSGALGPVLDALQVVAVPGGAAAVLASALVAWVQHRASDVRVRVERDGRSVEVEATRVRTLDADGVRRMVEAIAAALADPPTPPGPNGRPTPAGPAEPVEPVEDGRGR